MNVEMNLPVSTKLADVLWGKARIISEVIFYEITKPNSDTFTGSVILEPVNQSPGMC